MICLTRFDRHSCCLSALLLCSISLSPPCVVDSTATGTGADDAALGAPPGDAVVASTGVATGVEWVEYWDESAGASYFFNTVTQVGRVLREDGGRNTGDVFSTERH